MTHTTYTATFQKAADNFDPLGTMEFTGDDLAEIAARAGANGYVRFVDGKREVIAETALTKADVLAATVARAA